MEETKFKIDSLDKANWALTRIKKNEKEFELLKQQHDEMVKRADQWLIDESQKLTDSSSYLKSLLQDFATEELQRRNEGKKKPVNSIKLPFGKIGFKKIQPQISCGGFKCAANNQKLIETLNKMGLDKYVRSILTYKAAWDEVKENLVIDGDSVIYAPTGEIMADLTVSRHEGFEFTVKTE